MDVTSCYSCGATIEPNYHPKYCRRCGAKQRSFAEKQVEDKGNFNSVPGLIEKFSLQNTHIESTKQKFSKDEELRKQVNTPLRGLHTLWVSFAPIQLPVPFAEFKIDLRDEKHSESENTLKRLLQQRLDSVNEAMSIIERKLKEVGIQVITREEALASLGRSCLVIYLNLGAAKKKTRYSVRMYLEQEVQLVREPVITFTTQTWQYQSGDRRYFVDDEERKDKESNELLITIEEGMARFIYDYRSVND
jgi:hypothetical protein